MTLFSVWQGLRALVQKNPFARTEGFKLVITEVPGAEKHRVLLVGTGLPERAKDMADKVAAMFCDHKSNMGPRATQMHFFPDFHNPVVELTGSTLVYRTKQI